MIDTYSAGDDIKIMVWGSDVNGLDGIGFGSTST
jgi:hypothetical protein